MLVLKFLFQGTFGKVWGGLMITFRYLISSSMKLLERRFMLL